MRSLGNKLYGKHGVMQPVASFEAIHLNGTNSQAALHGAVTETMIGSNAPTRRQVNPRCLSLKTMHTMEHELTCELEGRFKVGYDLAGRHDIRMSKLRSGMPHRGLGAEGGS